MKLTTEQIAEFNTRGVIIAREALTHDDLQPVIDELSAWIDARARTLHEEGEIADLHEDAPFATRYGLLFKQCPEVGRGMDIMHYRGRAMFAFLRNENLLDLIESLLGPELILQPHPAPTIQAAASLRKPRRPFLPQRALASRRRRDDAGSRRL